MRLLVLVAASVAAALAACPLPRVRKAWSAHSASEKDLYIAAVGLGMQRGFHHRFVEIHTDARSSREAHGCLFFYWHRAFLLAYENMLRSLDPAYACVTVPLWDYATLGSSFIAGDCTDFEHCSGLLQDFGGSLPYDPDVGLHYYESNGVEYDADNCVVSPMTRHYCESSSAWRDGTCLGCMPRNDWTQQRVPAQVQVLSVYNAILGNVAPTLVGVTNGVNFGPHASVHNTLNSLMATFASPGDPVFYSHHTTIDAMHAIYYKCVVSASPPRDPARDSRTWSSCRNYNGVTIRATDTITMRVGESGQPSTSIWTAVTNPIYPFFQSLPRTYLAYRDTTQLGPDLSYTYDFTTTVLGDMYSQCSAFEPAMLLQDDASKSKSKSKLKSKKDKKKESAVTRQAAWLTQAQALTAQYYDDPSDALNQVNMMLCVYYHECLGGCFDYTESFKVNFRMSAKPPCKQVLDDLETNDCVIGVPGWEKLMLDYYPCDASSKVFYPDSE